MSRLSIEAPTRTRGEATAVARRVAALPVPLLAAAIALAGIVFRDDATMRYVGALILVYAISASALNLLLGVAGQFQLGHTVLMGIGAYTAAVITRSGSGDLLIESAIAVLLCALLALVVGVAALRVHGLYLGLATLALLLTWVRVSSNWKAVTGGVDGVAGIPGARIAGVALGELGLYAVAALVYVLLFAALRSLRRSTSWAALRSIAEGSLVAGCFGVDRFRTTLWVFVASGCVAGVSGVLYAHLVGFVNPDTFGLPATITIILMLVLGGLGTLLGPLFGAAVLVMLPQWISSLNDDIDLVYGAILLVAVLAFPKGIAGVRRPRRRGADQPASARPQADPRVLPRRTEGGPARLDVREVRRTFGGVTALDEVSFQVEPGAIHALIGPNGSGKTTFINCLTGVVPAERGVIELDGEAIQHLPAHQVTRRGVARTFQSPWVLGDLPVLENALLGWHPRREHRAAAALLRTPEARRERQRQVDEARRMCEAFGLGGVLDEPAERLGIAQLRFLELARALGARPRLLLLDEPAAGLTADDRTALAAVLPLVRDLGVTVLLIDHDMEFVFGAAERVTVFDKGRVIASGAPDEIRRQPDVVRAYFGAA